MHVSCPVNVVNNIGFSRAFYTNIIQSSNIAVAVRKFILNYFTGLPDNPLELKWLNERPVLITKRGADGPSLISDRDYESLVLTKMRQAAERQRLIEELIKQEENK